MRIATTIYSPSRCLIPDPGLSSSSKCPFGSSKQKQRPPLVGIDDERSGRRFHSSEVQSDPGGSIRQPRRCGVRQLSLRDRLHGEGAPPRGPMSNDGGRYGRPAGNVQRSLFHPFICRCERSSLLLATTASWNCPFDVQRTRTDKCSNGSYIVANI